MKTLLTIIFLLTTSLAIAGNDATEPKEKEVSRVFIDKNYLIKRALEFRTINDIKDC